jgi:hypothetical protein
MSGKCQTGYPLLSLRTPNALNTASGNRFVERLAWASSV